MKIHKTSIDGLLLVEQQRFRDSRGYFSEVYQKAKFFDLGIQINFVQDNHSRSIKNVLRGMHFQIKQTQAQLLTVIHGKIFDVAVDLRSSSPTFMEWFGIELSDSNKYQLFMPHGIAHGFCVLSDVADLHYKTTHFYSPDDEGGLNWQDPDISIKWPIKNPILSERDLSFPFLSEIHKSNLPQGF